MFDVALIIECLLKNLKLFCQINHYNLFRWTKGIGFYKICGAASVGEYNKVI